MTHRAAPPRCRGIVLILTLIALVLLMVAGMAMVRSTQTSSVLAGNLAFRRDLVNQTERGLARARVVLAGAALASEAQRGQDAAGLHYWAARLPSNASGIPLALLDTNAFAAAGMSAAEDIVENGVTVRWIIDRLCTSAGEFDESTCESTPGEQDAGGSDPGGKADAEALPLYRISVRADGPRNTLSITQATFSY